MKENELNHNEHHDHLMHHHEVDDHNHHDGHAHHEDHAHHGDFKKLFLMSLPIGLLIMWISPIMGLNIPFPFQYSFMYADLLALVLSTILIIFAGRPFFLGAVDEFKQKSPGMMALVSMGLSISFIYSVFSIISRYTIGVHHMDFLFEFASLLLIMLLGHWIEMVALGKAGDAKASLAKLLPKQAQRILEDGSIEHVDISQLNVGDKILVPAGENLAPDGISAKGPSRVNESLLTGESKPVDRKSTRLNSSHVRTSY